MSQITARLPDERVLLPPSDDKLTEPMAQLSAAGGH